MDAEEKLFALMAIAEEHQAAVRAGVEALAAERTKMEAQRSALSRQLREVAQTADRASGAMERAVQDALRVALAHTVNASASEVGRAFNGATAPVMAELAGLVGRAANVEGQLRGALAWLSWRWFWLIAASTGGVLFAIWFVSVASIVWQRNRIDALFEERAGLTAEVAQLQANAEAWAKRGGRAKLEMCGEQGRLCVRVDTRAAYGKGRDHFVLQGY